LLNSYLEILAVGRKESGCKGEIRCGGKARGRRGRFDTERKESEGEIV